LTSRPVLAQTPGRSTAVAALVVVVVVVVGL